MAFELQRFDGNPILELNPENHWEAGSVFNPGIIAENGLVRMLYRATNDTKREETGGYVSSVGYAESKDGIHFDRRPEALIAPTEQYEHGLGCEDPRITKIGDEYFIFYTAVEVDEQERKHVRVALATTTDFETVEKHGIIGPRSAHTKAACLLPEQDRDGQYTFLYTWESDSPNSSIMSVKFDSLEDVKTGLFIQAAEGLERFEDTLVLRPDRKQPCYRGPELGAVPIKTDKGYLFIYCGTNHGSTGEWTVNVALLDADDHTTVTARLPEPILTPQTTSELEGVVNHVTFPSGAYVDGDMLNVYYGSGDQGICLAQCSLDDLLRELESHSTTGPRYKRSYD